MTASSGVRFASGLKEEGDSRCPLTGMCEYILDIIVPIERYAKAGRHLGLDGPDVCSYHVRCGYVTVSDILPRPRAVNAF